MKRWPDYTVAVLLALLVLSVAAYGLLVHFVARMTQ